MSDRDLTRRTKLKVVVAGVDVSDDVNNHLMSLTYTDNEEDEADDLQIKMEDSRYVWLTQYLNAVVDKAAGQETAGATVSAAGSASGTVGEVVQFTGTRHYVSSTGNEGYTTKPGPAKITIINPGSLHPYHLIHTDGTTNVYGWVNAEDISGLGAAQEATPPQNKGLRIQAVISRENWNSDGKDLVLDTGEHSLDTVKASGPPANITIKCTSLPKGSAAAQTKRSKAWEAYYLSRIASEISSRAGLTCMYESAVDPYFTRVEQVNQTDISFLSQLCHNAGVSLKVTANIVVLFDQASYETKGSVVTITRGASGGYSKYNLTTGQTDTEYRTCNITYTDPATGITYRGSYTDEEIKERKKDEDDGQSQILNLHLAVSSNAEAAALAKKMLRMKNKYEKKAEFTVPGNPSLVAGITVTLDGWGLFDGKYIVSQSRHEVSSGGYKTTVRLRNILEGY